MEIQVEGEEASFHFRAGPSSIIRKPNGARDQRAPTAQPFYRQSIGFPRFVNSSPPQAMSDSLFSQGNKSRSQRINFKRRSLFIIEPCARPPFY